MPGEAEEVERHSPSPPYSGNVMHRVMHPPVAATPASPRAAGAPRDGAFADARERCEGDAGVAATGLGSALRAASRVAASSPPYPGERQGEGSSGKARVSPNR